MDEKYLWPLVGVALGWFLSVVSSAAKNRADQRRKLGRLVSKLLVVNDQIETLIVATGKIKDQVDGWESYEHMRKGITERHFLEPASHVDSLREAIDDLSETLPVEAVSLHSFIDMLLKNKKASLKAMTKNHDLYVRGISVYEAGMQVMQRELSKRLHRLAFRHGLETYARVLLMELRRSRNRLRTSAFVDKFTEDAFTELNRAGASVEATNPSAEARHNVAPGAPPSVLPDPNVRLHKDQK